RILHDQLDEALATPRRNADFAAFEQMRDAVVNGVLYQRLQKQRRHGDVAHIRGNVELGTQPLAETHALDREEGLREPYFLGQRNRLLAPERQALAKELRHQKAHLARSRRVVADQRRDRVQAVEQEMRIELRAQRFQLGLARQHLQLQRAPLGVARALERSREVV